MGRWFTVLGGAALLAVLACQGGALAALPPEVAGQIESQIQASRAIAASETALANQLENPQLAATMAGRAQERADATLAAAVVAIIASNRSLANEVVSTAVSQAPESRAAVLTAVQRAFPTLGTPPPPPINIESAYLAPAPLGTAAPVPVETTPAEGPPGGPEAAATGVIGEEPIVDTIEPVNRIFFAFNDFLDTMIARPYSAVYRFVTPEFFRKWLRNAYDNLDSPVILANDLLQLDFKDAAVTTGRFVINTTIGVAGFLDVATDFGLKGHHADFGQTLHSYGVGQGFYVMAPLFGPTTLRDGLAGLVDVFFQPLTYVLDTTGRLALGGGNAMVTREELLDALDDLKLNSIDYYAAVRGAYYQKRGVELRKGRSRIGGNVDALFDQME